jgi:FAD/FMN-containing dehydrogenase
VRAEPGGLWGPIAVAAGEAGLAVLHGSSRDVGVAGYTLGGDVGWLGRRYGLAANSVRAIELVTADGEHLRVDHENHPELFWGLRGGGGNFGVVTAVELELFPVETVYAGWLLWPVEMARRSSGSTASGSRTCPTR